ncbi:oocyte zinc finger protein XlCOF29-like [Pelobates fuscus]|uniref:oocyte zinc finger protein XlCOF29-like n=1 Tax=Pelobates fuscus TaxID=191477 RepID=UPI002FE47C5B
MDHQKGSLIMNKCRNQMAKRILNLALEIIYLLAGEDYIVVKKSCDHVRNNSSPCVSESFCRTQSPKTVPPPLSLVREQNNDKEILELTNQIIQLLGMGYYTLKTRDVSGW